MEARDRVAMATQLMGEAVHALLRMWSQQLRSFRLLSSLLDLQLTFCLLSQSERRKTQIPMVRKQAQAPEPLSLDQCRHIYAWNTII